VSRCTYVSCASCKPHRILSYSSLHATETTQGMGPNDYRKILDRRVLEDKGQLKIQSAHLLKNRWEDCWKVRCTSFHQQRTCLCAASMWLVGAQGTAGEALVKRHNPKGRVTCTCSSHHHATDSMNAIPLIRYTAKEEESIWLFVLIRWTSKTDPWKKWSSNESPPNKDQGKGGKRRDREPERYLGKKGLTEASKRGRVEKTGRDRRYMTCGAVSSKDY
jgi:hypothetical protein